MIGEPIALTYQRIVTQKLSIFGFSNSFDEITQMISKINDVRAQTMLIELLEEPTIYYPVCIDHESIILLIPADTIIDIENFDQNFVKKLEQPFDLSAIIIDEYIQVFDLMYLLKRWLIEVYNGDIGIFIGNNKRYIADLDSKLKREGYVHKKMPFLPVMFHINGSFN